MPLGKMIYLEGIKSLKFVSYGSICLLSAHPWVFPATTPSFITSVVISERGVELTVLTTAIVISGILVV
jgi:hypothetical protein